MRAALTLALISIATPSFAGPPNPDETEVSCIVVGARRLAIRRNLCTQRSNCWRKEREVTQHPQLRVIEGCKPVSPVWCFELAPRDDTGWLQPSCQPTLAACRRHRASLIRDVGPLPRGAKTRDTECSKRTGASFLSPTTRASMNAEKALHR